MTLAAEAGSVRFALLILNIVALVALVGIAAYLAFNRKSNKKSKDPANIEEFLDDEDLEGPRLERALGWALVCSAGLAVVLPLYWLREPARQAESLEYFDERAIHNGEVLYAAGPGDEGFDSAQSLGCAGCHGSDGSGGIAPVLWTNPDDEKDVRSLNHTAPALNDVLLRFGGVENSEELLELPKAEFDEIVDEVREIITFGRPGTPMGAWGVDGGGPKNEQSVDDIISYLISIQLTPEEAAEQAEKAFEAAKEGAQKEVKKAEENLEKAEKALEEAQNDPQTGDEALATAEEDVSAAQEALDWANQYAAGRTNVTDGQILYELHCARCHTKGFSIYDPTDPRGADVLGPAGGGGTQGFNLRDGGPVLRFPDPEDHKEFIKTGSEQNLPYGDNGIGSGRMPGFDLYLTDEMIDAIVEYERNGLTQNDPAELRASTSETNE